MSQDTITEEKTWDKTKKILLGVLGVVFAGVVYYQFFTGSSNAPANNPPVAVNSKATPAIRPSPRPLTGSGTAEPIVSQPLDLASISDKAGAGNGTGRNIFIYPTPTPPPPPPPVKTPPPPPPPPVALTALNPPSVIAKTGDFNLIVMGDKIPQDARIYLDGREYASTFVNANEIRARVPADAIRNSGTLGIMVRSAADAKLFSNQIALNVSEPPAPPYRFIGLIVSKKGSIAVLKSQGDDDVFNVIKDQKFGARWKVVSISPQKIVVEDTNLKISHSINFTGENG